MKGRTELCGEDCAERPICDLLVCIATCACVTPCAEPERWENCRHRPVVLTAIGARHGV